MLLGDMETPAIRRAFSPALEVLKRVALAAEAADTRNSHARTLLTCAIPSCVDSSPALEFFGISERRGHPCDDLKMRGIILGKLRFVPGSTQGWSPWQEHTSAKSSNRF